MTTTRRKFLQYLAGGTIGGVLGACGSGGLLSQWYGSQLNAPPLPLTGRAVQPTSLDISPTLRLHHIQTGYVAVKRAHRDYQGPDGMGIPAIAVDRHWTDWMPIHAWLLEHPEGLLVVDTGESARTSESDYFNCDPGTAFFYQSFLRFAVTPEDEIGAQMDFLDIPRREVRWIVQTHLHGDHMGGLSAFPESQVLVSAQDYPASTGTLPCRYPADFAPIYTRFAPSDLPGFARAQALTQAQDVWIIPTPGHSAGHQSVLIQTPEISLILAGDSTFDEFQLVEERLGGIVHDPSAARQTIQSLKTYCRAVPTVYLPSHDPQARQRLLDLQPVQV
jgi:glyoxylase-like metal-dependent hydrolase (beta-lactamase superfamily II)